MRSYLELMTWKLVAHAELRLREKDFPDQKLTCALRLAALAAELGERRDELAEKLDRLEALEQRMTEAQDRAYIDDIGFFIYRIGILFDVADIEHLLDELTARARKALAGNGILAN